jgi:7-cyano-7-deazaguanine synthase
MTNLQKKKAVVLLSGGLDSSVCLAVAKDMGFEIYALTVLYGQRHSREIISAKNICESFEIPFHKIIELDLRTFGSSALTDNLEVPKNQIPGSVGIPITYVPARNTIFLSLALAFAESIGSREIFIGVSSVDYSGYPDCRPIFISAFENVANLGTTAADDHQSFHVNTPVIFLSKGETILLGKKLGVDFSLTWSCYDPISGFPCQTCDSCQLRSKGFDDAGILDPLIFKCDNQS